MLLFGLIVFQLSPAPAEREHWRRGHTLHPKVQGSASRADAFHRETECARDGMRTCHACRAWRPAKALRAAWGRSGAEASDDHVSDAPRTGIFQPERSAGSTRRLRTG